MKIIGLFDSGIGGLSVLKGLLEHLPKNDFIYFADTLNLPYGEKSAEELKSQVLKIKDFFSSYPDPILVSACNTASSLFLKKDSYKGMKFFNIISPTVKKTSSLIQKNEKIGVLATPFTVNSKVYIKSFLESAPHSKVCQQEAPFLADFVEKGIKCSNLLKEYLHPLLNKQINILVLGCAHYFFLINEVKKIIPPHIQIIDSSQCLKEYLISKKFLIKKTFQNSFDQNVSKEKISEKKSKIFIYVSKDKDSFLEKAQRILHPWTIHEIKEIKL